MERISRFFVRYRVRISYFFAAAYFIFVEPKIKYFFSGLIFILVGEAIRIWASGYVRKNSRLTTEGPYSYVRNPLYLGNFLIGTGFTIISGSVFWIFLYLLSFFTIYVNLIKREEEKLFELFGTEFVNYKDNVPMLIPRFKRKCSGNERFDLNLMLYENGEWKGILGILSALFFLLIKFYYF